MKPKEPVQIPLCAAQVIQSNPPEQHDPPEDSRPARSLNEFRGLRFDKAKANAVVLGRSEKVFVLMPNGWRSAEAIGAYCDSYGSNEPAISSVVVRMESGAQFPVTSPAAILWKKLNPEESA